MYRCYQSGFGDVKFVKKKKNYLAHLQKSEFDFMIIIVIFTRLRCEKHFKIIYLNLLLRKPKIYIEKLLQILGYKILKCVYLQIIGRL